MQTLQKIGCILGLALAATCATAIAAPPLPAFTAQYQVLHNGAAIGTATMTLTPVGNGTWSYTTKTHGTSGLASLISANVEETSTFRWVGDLPQGESYDYRMSTALKQQHRSVKFDWNAHTIDVDDHGAHQFATQPGALERHTVPLAIAAGLAAGKTSFTLPVAVRDRIEMQHYVAHGAQSLSVPAGTFDATEVTRTDGGDGFEAWFAPAKLPVPIKIDQSGKSEFSMVLVSWSAR